MHNKSKINERSVHGVVASLIKAAEETRLKTTINESISLKNGDNGNNNDNGESTQSNVIRQVSILINLEIYKNSLNFFYFASLLW